MSCTENDSGPFVVFFLPAVVGCLTILLARRWAYSQVSSTSSTAVSRRRKIIKDPLVKRPLPLVPCKMTHVQVQKKTTGLSKKGNLPTQDEESNNGKRVNRSVRLSPSTKSNGVGFADAKLTDGPPPPKHIPFPYIPQDGELLFEAMTFVFTLAATGLQFLNLYRTTWWLPHSHTNQAMNFYLIDPHLVVFIGTILSRRFLLCLYVAILRCVVTPKMMPHVANSARIFFLGVILGSCGWCTYFIVLKYPISKIFYLCYPAVIYFLLFGVKPAPFMELSNSDSPLLHCCSQDAQQIRNEIDVLRLDFNMRVKKILFNSVVGAYYSSFIPCCFAQPFLYYDVYCASQQVAFVCCALLLRHAALLVSGAACDVPHRAALHLGLWRPLHDTDCADVAEWSAECVYGRGAVVQRGGGTGGTGGALFECVTPSAAAEPGDAAHLRFHFVFSNPSKLLCVLLTLQLALILIQVCLLLSTLTWHYLLSIIILLFINYYTLFKIMRDYLVAWKVYNAEKMIQDKNNSL